MTQPSSFLQGLTLIDAVVQRERSRRLAHNASRLAETTGIERSRVSRLTQELRELGFLERDPASVFNTGDAYFRTAGVLNQPWLRAARSDLRRLASGLGMSAQIAAPSGAGALMLRSETPSDMLASYLHPGMITPIWCTGAGRALLWEHSSDQLGELLRVVQFVGVGGPGAARSIAGVDALLARDRARGIVIADEEYVEGVFEYALPIHDGAGVVASVAVAGRRLSGRRAREAQSALQDVRTRLSALATAAD
jgi:DNA-binding IclR family transcriptional regulator